VSHPDTLGVILGGGLARRMGGGDKARVRIGGASILERVLARLRPQCARLILNANAEAARFADAGLPVVADSVPDFPGPLAGILAGLDFAAAQMPDVEWVVSAPSDCPFLPHDLVPRLHQARRDAGVQLACAASGGRRHPVVALWPVALREDLRRALVEERVRRVGEQSARYTLAVAEWPNEPLDPFLNVNTPEDVAEAERLAALYPDA
jgi:molybdopterin-guanine dinucleotide biosynthesis protein A